MKYVDPDGRIQRYSDNSIVFYPLSNETTEVGNSGLEIQAQWGMIKANDGSNIIIRINNSSKILNERFNCHGYTFTNGIGWIQPDQVESLLQGDNYRETESPESGGIFIQYDEDNMPFHSGKVLSYDKEKQLITVKEVLGATLFKDEDGKLRKTREYTYNITDMGNVKFFKNEGDKIAE